MHCTLRAYDDTPWLTNRQVGHILLCLLAVACAVTAVLSHPAGAPPISLYHQLSSVRYLNNGTTTSASVYGYQYRDVEYGELENITGVNEWWGGSTPFPILYESDYQPSEVCTAGQRDSGSASGWRRHERGGAGQALCGRV